MNNNYDSESYRDIPKVPEYKPTYPKMPEYKPTYSEEKYGRYEQYKNSLNNSVNAKAVKVERKKTKIQKVQKAIAIATVSVILLTGAVHFIKKADIPGKIDAFTTRIKDDKQAFNLADEIITRYNYKSHRTNNGKYIWYDEPKEIFRNIEEVEGAFFEESPENISVILSAVYLAHGDEEYVKEIAKKCDEKRGSETGIDVDALIGENWEENRHKLSDLMRENGSFESYRQSITTNVKGGK